MPSRLIGLWCWAYLVWALLTWTLTIEQVLFGVLIAAAVAVALAPLGEVPGPWRLLRPRALAGGAWLLAAAASDEPPCRSERSREQIAMLGPGKQMVHTGHAVQATCHARQGQRLAARNAQRL